MNPRSIFSLLFIVFFSSTIYGMYKQVWWVDPANRTYQGWNITPCRIQNTAVDNFKYELSAMLTLNFGRDEGILTEQLDFINLVAKKIGDSLGLSILVPSGSTEYLAQYGKSTGIIASIKFKCYALKSQEKKPILYDTQVVETHQTVFDTITVIKPKCDSIVVQTRIVDSIKIDTQIISKTVIDTQKVIQPILVPKRSFEKKSYRTFWEVFFSVIAVSAITFETILLSNKK